MQSLLERYRKGVRWILDNPNDQRVYRAIEEIEKIDDAIRDQMEVDRLLKKIVQEEMKGTNH